ESPFRHIFQRQTADLTIVNNSDFDILLLKQYPEDMYEYILKFFENLKLLSVIGLFPRLSLRNLPMTTYCLALLDGRLKELTTFIVDIGSIDDDLLIVYNMVKQTDHGSSFWPRFSLVFVNDVGQNFVICDKCRTIVTYKSSTGTGGLKKHLASCDKITLSNTTQSTITTYYTTSK
ncbi:unnamed protein product, partial [Rotaria magnacalcarata]